MTKRLTPKQQQAAKMIAKGMLRADIEQRLRLKTQTLSRWQRIPAFQDYIQQQALSTQQAMSYKLLAMRHMSLNTYYQDFKELCNLQSFDDTHDMLKGLHQLIGLPVDHAAPPPTVPSPTASPPPTKEKKTLEKKPPNNNA